MQDNTPRKSRFLPVALMALLTLVGVSGTAQADEIVRCPEPCNRLIQSVAVGDICLPTDFKSSCSVKSTALQFAYNAVVTLETTEGAALAQSSGTEWVTVYVDTDGAPYTLAKANGPEPTSLGENLWAVHFPAQKNHGDFLVSIDSVAAPRLAIQVLPDSESPTEPSYIPHPVLGTQVYEF
jgi:hypothetical protein